MSNDTITPPAGTYQVSIGGKKKDRYQEFADKHGITRAAAKEHLFGTDYGFNGSKLIEEIGKDIGPTGIRDLRTQLRKYLVGNHVVVCGESDSQS